MTRWLVMGGQEIDDRSPGEILGREAETFGLLAKPVGLGSRKFYGELHVSYDTCRHAAQQPG